MDLTNLTVSPSLMADAAIAAVLVLALIIGAKKGLLKSLVGVVIVVGALIGASFVADALAEPVAQWLGPVLQENIEEKLQLQNAADAETMLAAFHFDGENLQRMADEVMETVTRTGASLLSAVAESVAHSVAYAAVYLVAFLALLLGLWLLTRPLLLAVKLPGLKTLNALGGGALGLVWGVLLVFAAVWLMLRFDWVLTAEMVDNSRLLYFFAHSSPLQLLTSL